MAKRKYKGLRQCNCSASGLSDFQSNCQTGESEVSEYFNPISNKWETEDTIIKNIGLAIEFYTKGVRSKPVIYKRITADCTLYYIIYRKYMLCITSIFEDNNSIYLRTLYIKPEYRKQGIANKLLMKLFFC